MTDFFRNQHEAMLQMEAEEKIRAKIVDLEAQVTLHKEIADAREFDFHEAEKQIALLKEISSNSVLALKDLPERQFAKIRIEALETKSAQAYQVIGALSTHFDAFEHPDVQRALDYFSSDGYDPEFLPWVMK
jgi:hypothetical protein